MSARDDLSSYIDAGSVSEWAKDSVQWVVKAGFTDGAVGPQMTATRAQAALTRMNLAPNMMK